MRLAVELAAPVTADEAASAEFSFPDEGGAAPKFTIERAIPDAPEEEEDDDSEVLTRIDSVSSEMGDLDADLKGLQVREKPFACVFVCVCVCVCVCVYARASFGFLCCHLVGWFSCRVAYLGGRCARRRVACRSSRGALRRSAR
jgi:hypothetical protein